MSGTSSIHDWINSAGVVCAIAAAGASFWFSLQSVKSKDESLSFTISPEPSCQLEHQKLSDNEWIGLCWSVSVTNASEIKTSITDYHVTDGNGGFASWPGLRTLELPEGTQAALPVVLDGGESKKFLVRVPFAAPTSVTQITTTFAAQREKLPGIVKLEDLSTELAKHGLDIAGNSVEVTMADGKVGAVQWGAGAKGPTAELTLTTGRNRTFHSTLRWWPGDKE